MSDLREDLLEAIKAHLQKFGGPGPHGWKAVRKDYADVPTPTFARYVRRAKEDLGMVGPQRPQEPEVHGPLVKVSSTKDGEFVYDFDDEFRKLYEDAIELRNYSIRDGNIRSPRFFAQAWRMRQILWRDGLWALQEGREARLIQEYWDAMTAEIRELEPEVAARIVAHIKAVHSRFAARLSSQ